MAQINILDDNKIIYFDENTGNYKIYDGERWRLDGDKFGTSTKASGVALVDSAIVDKSVVGENEDIPTDDPIAVNPGDISVPPKPAN